MLRDARTHVAVGAAEKRQLAVLRSNRDVEELQPGLARVVLLQRVEDAPLRFDQNALPLVAAHQLVNRVARDAVERPDPHEEKLVMRDLQFRDHHPQRIGHFQIGMLLQKARLAAPPRGRISPDASRMPQILELTPHIRRPIKESRKEAAAGPHASD